MFCSFPLVPLVSKVRIYSFDTVCTIHPGEAGQQLLIKSFQGGGDMHSQSVVNIVRVGQIFHVETSVYRGCT